jgi:UDP-N-acetylmuramate--alanine ligase
MDDFLGAFDTAHEVALLPIYAASETPIKGITSEKMLESMRARGHRHVAYCQDLNHAKEHVLQALSDGKVVLLMGAGSIGALAQELREIIDNQSTEVSQ